MRPRLLLRDAALRDLGDDRLQPVASVRDVPQVVRERRLAADRLADAVGAHRPLVDAARDAVIVGAGGAELRFQELQRLRPKVRAGEDAQPVHPLLLLRPDAVEPADRQALHVGFALVRRDDEQPVRLVLVGGELGEELVVGHAGRGVEPGRRLDLALDGARDLGRRRTVPARFGNVEIGLVQRQGFDHLRVAMEHLVDLRGDGAVDVEAWGHEQEVRALPARRDARHRGTHAELPRLVARRRDHASGLRSADRERLAAQARIVALLHRRVERVHVDVDDLALLAHAPERSVEASGLKA